MNSKLRRDRSKIKEEVVQDIAEHISEIDKLLRENDRRAYTWQKDKSIETIVLALCSLSKNFKQTNKLASNLSALFQHAQGETCSISGGTKKEFPKYAERLDKKAPKDKHDIPWIILGSCEDCVFSEDGKSLGWSSTCVGCSIPEMSKFKPKK